MAKSTQLNSLYNKNKVTLWLTTMYYGCEFINYDIMQYCEKHKITFTRSRAYKKNDQAHVEQKNGSIVRRLLGYDRYEGEAAWEALCSLYAVLRLYINFFQPTLKLASKTRVGSKTTKNIERQLTLPPR